MKYSISFFNAILININIVIGAAFFFKTQSIAGQAGAYAPLAWLACSLLLVPLIVVFSHFARLYPEAGGIYVYSRQRLGVAWGFLSAWGYFIGTAACNVVVLKAFTSTLLQLNIVGNFFAAYQLPPVLLDVVFILFFAVMSLRNIQMLEKIQFGFSLLKIVPFAVLLLGALLLADFSNLSVAGVSWAHFSGTIPTIFFAFIGIEACSAIIDKVHDAKRNGFRVILVSFAVIVSIYALAQLLVVLVLGGRDVNPFLSILGAITDNAFIVSYGNKLIYAALLMSYLGGFYAMFYFNNWNLYAIAADKQIVASKALARLNKSQSPVLCVLAQAGLLMAMLLLVGREEFLLTMGDIGILLAFFVSVLAYLTIKVNGIGLAALVSCLVIAGICLQDFLQAGWYTVVLFVAMLGVGVVAYMLRSKDEVRN